MARNKNRLSWHKIPDTFVSDYKCDARRTLSLSLPTNRSAERERERKEGSGEGRGREWISLCFNWKRIAAVLRLRLL